jgi:hypothetical protein
MPNNTNERMQNQSGQPNKDNKGQGSGQNTQQSAQNTGQRSNPQSGSQNPPGKDGKDMAHEKSGTHSGSGSNR